MNTEIEVTDTDIAGTPVEGSQEQANLDSQPLVQSPEPFKLDAYRNTRRWFSLAVALQMSAVVSLATPRVMVLTTSPTMILKPVPVDPYDFFRGTYVNLSYDISRLKDARGMQSGKPVYVVMKKGSPTWTVSRHSVMRPKLEEGEMVIKGTVTWVDGDEATVTYGLERLYVPEGRGRELESNRDGMKVEVAVDRDGISSIKRVFLKERVIMDATNPLRPPMADL